MRLQGKTIITGAGSGIGDASARGSRQKAPLRRLLITTRREVSALQKRLATVRLPIHRWYLASSPLASSRGICVNTIPPTWRRRPKTKRNDSSLGPWELPRILPTQLSLASDET
jgi:hypothetical protein